MKFRILEQRGKFRIMKKGHISYYITTENVCRRTWFGVKFNHRKDKVNRKEGEWLGVCDKGSGPELHCESSLYTWGVNKIIPFASTEVEDAVEFDSYKKAENYVKKHYGLEGVKGIELPDWRQV